MIDMHVHTDDSPDAELPAAELVSKGMAEGLSALGFVAHVDLNPEDYCYDSFDAGGYDDSISKAALRAGGDLLVLKGIEVGEPHLYETRVRESLNYNNFDFITGALHTVKDVGMVLGKDAYGERDPLSVVEMYYQETLTMVEKADIDILAHMGLFRRGMALAGHDTHFSELTMFPEIIRRILETIIDRGIALELNTSGLRRHEISTYPVPEIMVLFRSMGGLLVTIGSDTHRDRHTFFGLKDGRDILLSAGFSDVYSFRRRDPESMSL